MRQHTANSTVLLGGPPAYSRPELRRSSTAWRPRGHLWRMHNRRLEDHVVGQQLIEQFKVARLDHSVPARDREWNHQDPPIVAMRVGAANIEQALHPGACVATSANPSRHVGCEGRQERSRLALAFDPARLLAIMQTRCSPATKTGNPGWQTERRLRPQNLGQRRQPLSHRGGLIVDNVVDISVLAAFDGDGRRRGCVPSVHE